MFKPSWSSSQVWVITSEDSAPPENELVGMAFTEDAIVVGTQGLSKYQAQQPARCRPEHFSEGRFSLVLRDGKRVVAKTDPLGQDVIYIYEAAGHWALSNSFWSLCRAVRERGLQCSLYTSALLAGFVSGDSLCEQLVSLRTPVAEIEMLPLGVQAVAAWGEGRPTLVREPNQLARSSPREYPDILRQYVSDWAGRLRSLLDHRQGSVSVDITGGQDSRIILGLLMASGADLSSLNFRSDKNFPEDYRIAQLLAHNFGFKLRNLPELSPSIGNVESLGLWRAGNLGVYLPVYLPRHLTPPPTLHLHGAGGEALRQSYAQTPEQKARAFKKKLDQRKHQRSLAREFLGAFEALQVELRDPRAMNEHYLQFRSRFHFGRNWVRQLTSPLVTPLVSRELLRASRILTPAQQNARQLAYDLLSLLDPSLPNLDFDKSDKSFPSEVRARSPWGSGPSPFRPDLRQLEYYGPESSPLQTPELAVNAPGARRALLEELDAQRQAALSTGIFTKQYIDQARQVLAGGKRLVKDGRQAAHIISAGEVARWAST